MYFWKSYNLLISNSIKKEQEHTKEIKTRKKHTYKNEIVKNIINIKE